MAAPRPDPGNEARWRRLQTLELVNGLGALALALALCAREPAPAVAIPLAAAFLACGANALRLRRRVWSALERELRAHRRAEQEARAADGAKGRLLANVSHEIRTPLHGILGLTDLLLASGLSPFQNEQAKLVRSSAEALLTLVDDALDLARIDAGRLRLRQRDFRLRELAGDVLRLLAPQAAEREVALRLEVAPELPDDLNGDPARLRQALLNLVGNAVRFTRRGSVTVAAVPHEEGRSVRFEVRDTGIGIRPELQARLFEPFAPGESSPSRPLGGTGLGLAITRGLVDLMAGEIGFESAPGQGSAFWFHLPLARAAGAAAPAPIPASASAPNLDERRRQARGSRRILIVDDRAANRSVARALLSELGYESAFAASGEEALDLLAGERFDALLLDGEMPGLDGAETCRRLRRREVAGRRTPVIAVTANAGPEAQEACREAGMDAFLGKPFRTAELAAALDQWTGLEAGDGLAERLAALRALPAGDGPDLGTQTVAAFLAQGENDLATLRRALVQQDAALLADAAHGLAGSAALLGARDLAESAGELAALARGGDLAACATRLPRVEHGYQEAAGRMR